MPKLHKLPSHPDIPQLEEEILKFWQKDLTFEKSVESRPKDKPYVFYDGPPFATGMPHHGHLLGSTSKDVIARYWTMKGYRVERVWGWDCHGLPIENMIEKQLKIKGGKKGIEELGIGNFNAACRKEVLRLDKEWEKIIARLGRWVDFKHSYKTMDNSYMESVWWGFKQLYDKGLIYEGKKVILYCPRCSTPLSNFEIAMDNSYHTVKEPSTYYKYPVKGQKNTFLLAWSTTPWNKLATTALAVNPKLTYVKVKQGNEYFILAESRLEILKPEPIAETVEKLKGTELEKLEYELHFDFYPNRSNTEKAGVIVADDYVTDEEGTGVVTLAVYGEDDFRVMSEHNVQLVEHVDEEGKLKDEVKPWAGMDILEVNPLIDADLKQRGLIYYHQDHEHSVAHCYRCDTRLYYTPLPAWFIDVAKLRPQLIAQNEKMNWYPEHLKHGRFGKGLETAPDWNISRSRYWGNPMPVWRSADGKHTRVIGSLEELKEWAVDRVAAEKVTDLHREFIDPIELYVDDDRRIVGKRIPEVLDTWIDSGSMPFASRHYPFENEQEFEASYPAQFVSEYIAQTRAWFYTMHVMSVGIFGANAVENTLTTGTFMAADGNKLSKSKKNYTDPMELINKYGVDSFRLYMMSSTVMKGESVNFRDEELDDIRKRVFLIWWNTLAFYRMYAGVKPVDWQTAPTSKHPLDRWIVSTLHGYTEEMSAVMDQYNVVRASRLIAVMVNDLSTWYLRRSRDRIRNGDQQAQHALGWSLVRIAQLAAPFTPFFSEIVFHNLVDDQQSIHLTEMPCGDLDAIYPNLNKNMYLIQQVAEKAHSQRKALGIKVRQPLAKIVVQTSDPKPSDEVLNVLAEEINVKQVDWQVKEGIKLSVELETKLTPELKSEGEARELMRQIQKLRRKVGLKPGESAKVEAPSWPTEYQKEIETTTSTTLSAGDTLKIVA